MSQGSHNGFNLLLVTLPSLAPLFGTPIRGTLQSTSEARMSVHASRLSWILNSLLFLVSGSLLELVPSRSSFQLAGHLHPSTTLRFDRDTRRCEHVVLILLSLCPHMLDIVLSARTFPHLPWSHRILSLECLSLEFFWFGCRRPHVHLPLMQALKMPRRIWLVSVVLLVEFRLWP